MDSPKAVGHEFEARDLTATCDDEAIGVVRGSNDALRDFAALFE